MTQQKAAKLLGITQPRLNLLLKGKIEKFSLGALVNMLAKAGMCVKLTVRKQPKGNLQKHPERHAA